MSLYIPGVSVSFCLDCPCADPLYIDDENMMWVCRAVQKGRRIAEKNLYEKQPWCPLIEVPPHGRLIDADALRAENNLGTDCSTCKRDARSCRDEMIHSTMDFCEWIDDAPTIIPADKEGP